MKRAGSRLGRWTIPLLFFVVLSMTAVLAPQRWARLLGLIQPEIAVQDVRPVPECRRVHDPVEPPHFLVDCGAPGPDSVVSWSPEGRFVAMHAYPVARVWDLETQCLHAQVESGNQAVVELSTDGQRLLTRNGPEETLWDLSRQTAVATITVPYGAQLSPRGHHAVLMEPGGFGRLWDLDTCEAVASLPPGRATFFRDGSGIRVEKDSNPTRFYGLPDLRPVARREDWELCFHSDGYLAPEAVFTSYSPGGEMKALASERALTLIDQVTGCAHHLAMNLRPPAAFDSHGRLQVAQKDANRYLSIERVSSQRTEVLIPGEIQVKHAQWSPDLRFLSVEAARGHSLGGILAVVDKNDLHVDMLRENGFEEARAAWSWDGRILAYSPSRGVVRLWDPAGRREIAALKLRTAHPVVGLHFSRTGRRIAIVQRRVAWASLVTVWDRVSDTTGELEVRPVDSITFSPDERTVAILCKYGPQDREETDVRTFSVSGGKPAGTLHCGRKTTRCLGFSRDGTRVYLLRESTVLVLRADTLAQERAIPVPVMAPIEDVRLSPTGRYLCAESDDAVLLDLASGRVIRRVDDLRECTFTPDGRQCLLEVDGARATRVATRVDLDPSNGPIAPGIPGTPPPHTTASSSEWSSRVDVVNHDGPNSEGRLLASLQLIETGAALPEWFMWTPSLHYACSPGAHRYVRLFKDGARIPLRNLDAELCRPDLVRRSVRGSWRNITIPCRMASPRRF